MKINKQRIRLLEQQLFSLLMKISVGIIMISLLVIIGTILYTGLPAMNLDMIIKTPKGGFYLGKEGGILNAIIGSLCIGLGSTVLAFIISLPVVFYLNIYAKRHTFICNTVRFFLDVLWGIPSIVFGAFGFVIMLFIGLKVSLLAGIITVALLVLPIMSRAMDEVFKTIPNDLYEAAYSLGATRWEMTIKVASRQVLPGIITAILISFGRAIGDAPSVLFTAGFTDNIPDSLTQPAATLPLAIFFQLGSPIPEVRERAYAAAFILTVIILIISLCSRYLLRKQSKHIF